MKSVTPPRSVVAINSSVASNPARDPTAKEVGKSQLVALWHQTLQESPLQKRLESLFVTAFMTPTTIRFLHACKTTPCLYSRAKNRSYPTILSTVQCLPIISSIFIEYTYMLYLVDVCYCGRRDCLCLLLFFLQLIEYKYIELEIS